MTIALSPLPRAFKETPGTGTITYQWNGTAWVYYSGSCTNGNPYPPETPGTTVNETANGTCSIHEDLTEVIHTLLQDPDGKIDELVEKYHSHALSRLLCQSAAINANRGNGCIIHNYEPTPSPKINQLVIPTGSTRWSYCLLLADDDIKDQIYEACDKGSANMNLIFGTPITGREEQEHAITLTVKVLPPRRLSPHSDDETLNTLWIIPVVDDRYTWQFAHTGDLSGLVTDSAITAPDDAVEVLLDQLGVDYLNVGVNTAHTLTPSCLNKNDYENLPIVLDSIATHYGQRLVADIGSYNTVTGKYDNIEFETSPGGETRWALIDGLNSRYVYDNNLLGKLGLRECVWGGGGESISTNASAANYIVGRPFVVAGGMISSYGTAATPPHVPYASTPSSVDIQTTSGTYVNKTPGTEYKTMAITAIWRTEFDEDPSTGMKDQLGRDYFYQFYRQFDWTFAGVQPWQQGYFDDYMVLRQTWNPKTCQYDAFTRVCSRQPNLTGEWVTGHNTRLQGKMIDDLLAAVNTKRDPSTGRVKVLRKKSNGDLTLSTTIYTLTNRFENISINKGSYVKFEWMDGEWQPYAADCPSDASTSESF